MPKVQIVIPSFRGANRLQRQLESVLLHDPKALHAADWIVVEDPSDDRSSDAYHRVLRDFPLVSYFKLGTWSNMHGAAMQAFEIARDRIGGALEGRWIIYLGDDVMVTPLAISSLLFFLQENELNTLGLVQIPYWNAHELYEDQTYGDRRGPALLRTKEDMYTKDPSWLLEVPRNSHWDGEGYARPYVNVNGCGFACRLDHYFGVGGFAKGTWCLDESISVRTWLRSEKSIVCLPGPPFVHYFGAATECDPPAHDLHTAERWTEAMGMTKEEAGKLSYEKMFEREPAVQEEMARAKYLTSL